MGSLRGLNVTSITKHAFKNLTRRLSLNVVPKTGLVDEPLQVTVSGLNPYERATLLCTLEHRNKTFAAVGNYAAGMDGVIKTEYQSSFGGSYVGNEPEGLIWSMRPLSQKSRQRVLIEDVTKPFDFQLKVFRDVLTLPEAVDSKPEADINFERWYKASNVSRTLVKADTIRGALFMPEGKGPYVPIIDMFGGIGGLSEHRAALLASRGYAVLALAHFAYDDLPKTSGLAPLEYFEEAIDWILNHDKRIKEDSGVNVIGTCLGGYYALAMAEAFPEVTGVVAINAFFRPIGEPTSFKNKIRQAIYFDPNKFRRNKDGDIIILDSTTPENFDDDVLEIENSKAKFLFIAGDIDESISPMWSTKAAERLHKHGHKNYEVVIHPGAGHLIEPPHAPFCDRAPVKNVESIDGVLCYGGEPCLHAKAQVNSWARILKFLPTN